VSGEVVAAIRSHPGSAPLVRSQRPVRLAAAAVALAASTAQLINFGVYDQRLQPLDMMTHDSVFGVVSLAALGVAVLAALAIAVRDEERRVRFAFLSGLLGVLLALRVAQPSHVLLLALPVSAAALTLLWTAAPAGTAQRVLRDGCIVLVLAFLVHGVGAAIVSWLGLGPDTWGYQLKALVKHSGELAGWLLVAAALTLLAVDRQQLKRAES
jgi:hypothetical protein